MLLFSVANTETHFWTLDSICSIVSENAFRLHGCVRNFFFFGIHDTISNSSIAMVYILQIVAIFCSSVITLFEFPVVPLQYTNHIVYTHPVAVGEKRIYESERLLA